MDEIVTQYLPQAFAFIYVINSANAGGVQKDRVSNIATEINLKTLSPPPPPPAISTESLAPLFNPYLASLRPYQEIWYVRYD